MVDYKGVDEDFGKTPKRLFPVEEAPFYAVVCDTENEGNANDVTGMRVLVSMGGLMTSKNAEVIDEMGNPIEGLFALGNTQGGRFVDEYPATLSGASHASALTGGYLIGPYISSK